MCKAIGGLIANVLKCTAAAVAFLFFLAAIGPLNTTLLGNVAAPTLTPYTSLGVSVFYAGVAYNPLNTSLGLIFGGSSNVAWTDLNTQNACNDISPVFSQWAKPLGLCVACNNTDAPNGYCFGIPSEVKSQQAMLVIAVLLTGSLFILRFINIFCCAGKLCKIVDGLLCFCAVPFATATFPIWQTLPIASSYQTVGGRIPVATATGVITLSDPVQMGLSYSFRLMIVGFFFTLVAAGFFFVEDFSSCMPSCKSDKKEEDDGGYCMKSTAEKPKEAPKSTLPPTQSAGSAAASAPQAAAGTAADQDAAMQKV